MRCAECYAGAAHACSLSAIVRTDGDVLVMAVACPSSQFRGMTSVFLFAMRNDVPQRRPRRVRQVRVTRRAAISRAARSLASHVAGAFVGRLLSA